MADVKTHLDRISEQVALMRVTSKLMLSAQSEHFDLTHSGVLLLDTFAGMINNMAVKLEAEVGDLDLAISMKGHSK